MFDITGMFSYLFVIIKNNILKILGPFGFQESGSLSFDHIVDFHDYINIFLIFIFVLVTWSLLYAVNIVRVKNIAIFIVLFWYLSNLFLKTITLLFNVIAGFIDSVSLSNTLVFAKFNAFVKKLNIFTILDTFMPTSENNETDINFNFYSILILAISFIFLIQSIFNFILRSIYLLIYVIKDFYLILYEIEIQLFLYNNTMLEHIRRLSDTEFVNDYFKIYRYSLNFKRISATTDVFNLYANIFNKFLFTTMIFDTITRFLDFTPLEYFYTSIKPNISYGLTLLFKQTIFGYFFISSAQTVVSKISLKNLDFNQFSNTISLIYQRMYLGLIRFTRRLTHASTLEIIWTIFPSIILLFIAIPSLILLYELDAVAPVALGIKIIGRQWYWSYSIGSSFPIFKDLITLNLPEFSNWDSYMIADESSSLRLLEVDNPLFLPAGVPITLFMTASDVIHSWAVPALGVKVDCIPGRLNQVSFTLYDTGVFYGQCSELCGVNHGFMPIQIISLVDNSNLI